MDKQGGIPGIPRKPSLTLLTEGFFQHVIFQKRSREAKLSIHVLNRDRQQTFLNETESLQRGRKEKRQDSPWHMSYLRGFWELRKELENDQPVMLPKVLCMGVVPSKL